MAADRTAVVSAARDKRGTRSVAIGKSSFFSIVTVLDEMTLLGHSQWYDAHTPYFPDGYGRKTSR
jgi:hypothetical protein